MREFPKYLAFTYLGVLIFRVTDLFHTFSEGYIVLNFVLSAMLPLTAVAMSAIFGTAMTRSMTQKRKETDIMIVSALLGTMAVVADGFFNTVEALRTLTIKSDELGIHPDLAYVTALAIGVMPSVLAFGLAALSTMLIKKWTESYDLPFTKTLRKLSGGGNFTNFIAKRLPWNVEAAKQPSIGKLYTKACPYCGVVFEKPTKIGAGNALKSHLRPSTDCGKQKSLQGKGGNSRGNAGQDVATAKQVPGSYPAVPSTTPSDAEKRFQ